MPDDIDERDPGESKKKFDESSETTITGNEIDLFETGKDLKEIRGELPDWAKTHGITGMHKNNDTGWTDIRVSRKSIKDVVAHGGNMDKLKAIAGIPGFIANGIHLQSELTEGNQRMTSHVFAAKFKLRGRDYVAGYVIREDVNGKRYYDHEITEMANLDVLRKRSGKATGAASKKSGHTVTHQGRIFSIIRKYLLVK